MRQFDNMFYLEKENFLFEYLTWKRLWIILEFEFCIFTFDEFKSLENWTQQEQTEK